jgi:hypothetical protein
VVQEQPQLAVMELPILVAVLVVVGFQESQMFKVTAATAAPVLSSSEYQ